MEDAIGVFRGQARGGDHGHPGSVSAQRRALVIQVDCGERYGRARPTRRDQADAAVVQVAEKDIRSAVQVTVDDLRPFGGEEHPPGPGNQSGATGGLDGNPSGRSTDERQRPALDRSGVEIRSSSRTFRGQIRRIGKKRDGLAIRRQHRGSCQPVAGRDPSGLTLTAMSDPLRPFQTRTWLVVS